MAHKWSSTFYQRNLERCVRIFAFMFWYFNQHGYNPAFRQIGLSVGITSSSHISWYIKKLTQEGYITSHDFVSRSAHLTAKGEAAINAYEREHPGEIKKFYGEIHETQAE